MLALVEAIRKWRPYLLGSKFTVKTNYSSLKYLLEQKITIAAQVKWLTKLVGFDYEVVYRKEKENVVVDALSRRNDEFTVEC